MWNHTVPNFVNTMIVNARLPIVLFLMLNSLVREGMAGCYFSVDFQGEFVTQVASSLEGPDTNLAGDQIQYSTVHIQPDGIPIWGKCHKKIGKNVILVERGGSTDCYRCFQMSLRSANIIHMATNSLDRCYAREAQAVEACSKYADVTRAKSEELLLFRNGDMSTGVGPIETYCPINGQFTLTYTRQMSSSQAENSADELCARKSSILTNCPDGSKLNLTFNGCRRNLELRCLGDWASENSSERFVAFLDEKAADHEPKYRCGLYSEDAKTGRTTLALSRDSSCKTNLFSSSIGHEVFELTPLPGPRVPSVVKKSNCVFPDWLSGGWEAMEVDRGSLTYKDKFTFQTLQSDCVQKSYKHQNRYLVYTRTHCGDEYYNCVWFESRTANVMEFQFGTKPSTTPSFDLCDNNRFLQKTWTTQARNDRVDRSACPISGEYSGILPDGPQFCAKMSSDCNNPDIMFYSVSDCTNSSEVLEDREYQCLGQWEEDGLLYTYTQRRDLPSHECFVGEADAKAGLFLMEAGVNCRRGLAVSQFGMQLTKKSNCLGGPQLDSNGKPWYVPRVKPSRPIYSLNAEDISTKAWQPMTGEPPDQMDHSGAEILHTQFCLVLATIFLLFHNQFKIF